MARFALSGGSIKSSLMHKLLSLLFVLLFHALNLKAQTLEFANGLQSSGNVKILCSDHDQQGNLLLGGFFTGSFDADPDLLNSYYLQSTGNLKDAFLIKYNANGNLVWAFAMGSGSGDEEVRSLAVDANGDVLLSGIHGFSFDADPDTAVRLIPYNNQVWTNLPDVFVMKFSANGNHLWSFALGSRFNDLVHNIDLTTNGSIVITGVLEDSLDFNPDTAQLFLAPSIAGFGDAFMASYDANGVFLWVKKIGNATSIENFFYVDVSLAGNIYTGGTFTGDVDFNPSPSAGYTLSAEIPLRYFIAKYDGLGNFIWARKLFSTTGDSHLNGITTDNMDNLYLCGDFSDTVDFNLANAQIFNLVSTGNLDGFVARYAPNAAFVWAKQIGTLNGNEIFESICTNPQQELWLSAKFNESILDADPGPAIDDVYGQGNNDVLVLSLDLNGNFAKAMAIGGAGEENNSIVGSDSTGLVWIMGAYNDTVDFDLSWQTNFLTANQQSNCFLARYDFNQIITHGTQTNNTQTHSPLLFPNPNNGDFFLQFKHAVQGEYKIYNLQGQVVLEEQVNIAQQALRITLKNQPPGTYWLKWSEIGSPSLYFKWIVHPF